MTELTNFLDLGICEQLNQKLLENNLTNPTPVQKQVIPELLQKNEEKNEKIFICIFNNGIYIFFLLHKCTKRSPQK